MDTMNATHTITSNGMTLIPLEIEMNPMTPREGVQVLGLYGGNSQTSPLVLKQILNNQTEVFYMNVYLMNKALINTNEIKGLLHITMNLLDLIKLPKYDKTLTSWVVEDDTPVFAFKTGSFKGNTSIYADSIIFEDEITLSEVEISINNNTFLLKDVISLSIQNFNGEINLFSQNVKIDNGKGFYTYLSAENPEITLKGSQILISALTLNETQINFEGFEKALLSLKGNVSTYIRYPHIQHIGNASFQNVFAFRSYLDQLKTMGQDLLIEGEVKFSLPLSDEYNLAYDFTWNGVPTREPEVVTWDELSSLKESYPYFILTIIIILILWRSQLLIKKGYFNRAFDHVIS